MEAAKLESYACNIPLLSSDKVDLKTEFLYRRIVFRDMFPGILLSSLAMHEDAPAQIVCEP